MSLHRCTELTEAKLAVEDQKSLDIIANEFTFAKYLGSGRIGHAFLLAHGPKEQMVMKVLPCNAEAEAEIRTACLLNNLQSETGIFAYAYGWLSCSKFPKDYVQYLPKEKIPDAQADHIYLFSEFIAFAWNDVNFRYSDKDYRLFLFILIHGISIGRKHVHFFHQDIAEGNILLTQISHTETISFKTDTREFELTGLRFVPKLIDYGEAKTKPDSTNNKFKRRVSDLRLLADEFIRMMELQNNKDARRPFVKFTGSYEFQETCNADASNYESLQELLEHPYFDIPEIKRLDPVEKKNKALGRCIQCTTPAVQKFQGTPLNVCEHARCIQKMQKVAAYMANNANNANAQAFAF